MLFKKIFEKFKKQRPWKIRKIRNKNHPKTRTIIIRNGPIMFYHRLEGIACIMYDALAGAEFGINICVLFIILIPVIII